jgi:hypothetical protein
LIYLAIGASALDAYLHGDIYALKMVSSQKRIEGASLAGGPWHSTGDMGVARGRGKYLQSSRISTPYPVVKELPAISTGTTADPDGGLRIQAEGSLARCHYAGIWSGGYIDR